MSQEAAAKDFGEVWPLKYTPGRSTGEKEATGIGADCWVGSAVSARMLPVGHATLAWAARDMAFGVVGWAWTADLPFAGLKVSGASPVGG